MPPTAATSNITINRVLRVLWEQAPISRIEIARILDLDKSTVTKIVSSLMEQGIIVETSLRDSGPAGGRKAVNLSMNPDYGFILGMEIQTEGIRSTLVDLTGAIREQDTEALELDGLGIFPALSQCIRRRKTLLENRGIPLIALGIGISGLIDPGNGTVLRSNPLGIKHPMNLKQELEDSFGLPVFIENDTKCCCWAEMVKTRRDPPRSFMYILGEFRRISESLPIRTLSVGFSFVINGSILYGENFTTGEFRSILKRDRHHTQFSASTIDEGERFEADPAVHEHVLDELARNGAFLFNMLNLGWIGLAGDLEEYRDELIRAFHREIQENWVYPNQSKIEVGVTSFGKWAVAYGAGAVVLENLFAVPQIGTDCSAPCRSGIELFQYIGEVCKTGAAD